MDIRSLIGFVAVAEELNFRRAAERLHLSQPALSRVVARVEREVGVELLERSTTHVDLTAAGEVFLTHIRSLLTSFEEAIRAAKVHGTGGGRNGRLRVATNEWAEGLVLPTLHAFRQSVPRLDLAVKHLDDGCPVEDLCTGRVDVAFCRSVPHDHRVDAARLVEEPLVAAIPATHPLVEHEQVDMSALAGEPLALFPREFAPSAHDQVVELCDRAGFQPHIAHEAVPLTPLAALVAAEAAIALVPQSITARFNRGFVRFRPIDGPVPRMPLVLARRHADASTAVEQLSRAAEETLSVN